MTSLTLRLSPTLEAMARNRARELGVSLNALISVSLDAYLRGCGVSPTTAEPVSAHVRPVEAVQPIKEAVQEVPVNLDRAARRRAEREAKKSAR